MKEDSVYVFGKQIRLPMLIRVSRVRSHVASRVTWHSHKGWEILCLLDGATAYEFPEQNQVELHGGQFLVVPPGVVHRGLADVRSPCTICGLAFKTQWSGWLNTAFTSDNLDRLKKAMESGALRAHPFSPAMRWLVRRLMDETAAYSKDGRRSDAALALRALIAPLLVESMRQILVPPVEPKVFVSAAISYLRRHLQEQISIDDLVRFVGFGRARLFDIFKAQTGLTPNDYLQRLRVERAQQQLMSTTYSITEIALSSGFSSGQYFSTVFARYTGVSPTEFRQGARPRRIALPASSKMGS